MFLSTGIGLALLLAIQSSVALPHVVSRDLNSFVDSERATALQGILANIGPDGSLSMGADAGVVIASPSTVNPDYLYTWTRDSALTLKTVIDEFINGNSALQPVIEAYIKAEAVKQTIANPSGVLQNGAGLGEPKFNIDLTSFNKPWGRPQRDGPALRAIALMNYIEWLRRNGGISEAKTTVWPVVINDLNYVGQYWNQTGFDLWEEISGSSFFTYQNQHRALAQGSQVAKELGLSCTSCDSQAPEILCFLQSFWNGEYYTANINAQDGRTGKDSNTILGPIAVFDIDAYCDSPTLQPCASQSLANFKVLVDSFRTIYTINANSAINNSNAAQAVAIGRYPEDTYYGGNPWYLCTLAAAEFLYDAVAQWEARHSLTIDETSYAFFKEIYPATTQRVYLSGNYDSPFFQIMRAVTAYADGFVDIIQQYIPTNGSISEQFNRDTGLPESAYDLTWSFASFVTMAQRRSGQYPRSWGTRNITPAPATCAGTSAQGVYAPATGAGAPSGNQSCTVDVLFDVNATTYFGENIYIYGNTSILGDWNLNDAFPMNAQNYSSTRPLWYAFLNLPASQKISYNYLRQESDGSYLYETINRTYTVPACGYNGTPMVEDSWTGATDG
ncbi:MAG: hypothetical protein MMC33_002514 [Icmadophila ericetorum]|nr:hypothetical protein [Icmadophila ericetorum]